MRGIKLKSFIVVVFIILSFSCSRKSPMEQEYENLKNQGLKGFELLGSLRQFELEHSNHFESKVDLANFYLLTGEYNVAYEYSLRAESVLNFASKSDYGKEAICIMYGDRAKLELIFGNYDTALDYVNKAIKKDKKDEYPFKFLKAQILYAQKKVTEALEILDTEFMKHEDMAVPADYKTYMNALAENYRFEEARLFLDRYLEFGEFYYGLGTFASAIYENCQDFENSILVTFLDYDYAQCFSDKADVIEINYINNIDVLDGKLKLKTYYEACLDALNLLKCYFLNETNSDIDVATTDFFVKRYIDYIIKINNKSIKVDEFEDYLSLNDYFVLFPSYYWYCYLGIEVIEDQLADYSGDNRLLINNVKKDKKNILEKIIDFGGNNNFAPFARNALGEYIGLSENESESILTIGEVYRILVSFKDSRDASLLEPIYDLLSLPDNDYTMAALSLLKKRHMDLGLDYILLERRNTATDKLKERIEYLLN